MHRSSGFERLGDLKNMKKNALRKFRTTLESKQSELAKGNRIREDLAIATSSDELDRIQEASARDYAMNHLERVSNRLREVRTALRRIDTGSFGVCAGCEDIISPRRLAAVPWASFCVVCQEAADRGQNAAREGIDLSLAVTA